MGSCLLTAETRNIRLNILYTCIELQADGAVPRLPVLFLLGRIVLERDYMVGGERFPLDIVNSTSFSSSCTTSQ